jgi:hypothetical protein
MDPKLYVTVDARTSLHTAEFLNVLSPCAAFVMGSWWSGESRLSSGLLEAPSCNFLKEPQTGRTVQAVAVKQSMNRTNLIDTTVLFFCLKGSWWLKGKVGFSATR